VRTDATFRPGPEVRFTVRLGGGKQAGVAEADDAVPGMAAQAEWLVDAAPDDPDLYQTLASFYERERRWSDAAGAYVQAIKNSPRSTELKTQYASALITSPPARVESAW